MNPDEEEAFEDPKASISHIEMVLEDCEDPTACLALLLESPESLRDLGSIRDTARKILQREEAVLSSLVASYVHGAEIGSTLLDQSWCQGLGSLTERVGKALELGEDDDAEILENPRIEALLTVKRNLAKVVHESKTYVSFLKDAAKLHAKLQRYLEDKSPAPPSIVGPATASSLERLTHRLLRLSAAAESIRDTMDVKVLDPEELKQGVAVLLDGAAAALEPCWEALSKLISLQLDFGGVGRMARDRPAMLLEWVKFGIIHGKMSAIYAGSKYSDAVWGIKGLAPLLSKVVHRRDKLSPSVLAPDTAEGLHPEGSFLSSPSSPARLGASTPFRDLGRIELDLRAKSEELRGSPETDDDLMNLWEDPAVGRGDAAAAAEPGSSAAFVAPPPAAPQVMASRPPEEEEEEIEWVPVPEREPFDELFAALAELEAARAVQKLFERGLKAAQQGSDDHDERAAPILSALSFLNDLSTTVTSCFPPRANLLPRLRRTFISSFARHVESLVMTQALGERDLGTGVVLSVLTWIGHVESTLVTWQREERSRDARFVSERGSHVAGSPSGLLRSEGSVRGAVSDRERSFATPGPSTPGPQQTSPESNAAPSGAVGKEGRDTPPPQLPLSPTSPSTARDSIRLQSPRTPSPFLSPGQLSFDYALSDLSNAIPFYASSLASSYCERAADRLTTVAAHGLKADCISAVREGGATKRLFTQGARDTWAACRDQIDAVSTVGETSLLGGILSVVGGVMGALAREEGLFVLGQGPKGPGGTGPGKGGRGGGRSGVAPAADLDLSKLLQDPEFWWLLLEKRQAERLLRGRSLRERFSNRRRAQAGSSGDSGLFLAVVPWGEEPGLALERLCALLNNARDIDAELGGTIDALRIQAETPTAVPAGGLEALLEARLEWRRLSDVCIGALSYLALSDVRWLLDAIGTSRWARGDPEPGWAAHVLAETLMDYGADLEAFLHPSILPQIQKALFSSAAVAYLRRLIGSPQILPQAVVFGTLAAEQLAFRKLYAAFQKLPPESESGLRLVQDVGAAMLAPDPEALTLYGIHIRELYGFSIRFGEIFFGGMLQRHSTSWKKSDIDRVVQETLRTAVQPGLEPASPAEIAYESQKETEGGAARGLDGALIEEGRRLMSLLERSC